MILFGYSISPYVRKVLIVAAEKGIALDVRPVNPRTSDDAGFIAASPFRKMPALADGDFTLADSTAIVTYFESLKPTPAFLPTDARARAKAIWFEEMADTIMFTASSPIFFNRCVSAKFLNIPGDEKVANETQANVLPPIHAYLESVAPANGYLVGDSISIGDVAVTSQLINLALGGAPVDAAKYPKLAAYYARMVARPSIAPIIAADRAILGL